MFLKLCGPGSSHGWWTCLRCNWRLPGWVFDPAKEHPGCRPTPPPREGR